jgi:hypothetical protein
VNDSNQRQSGSHLATSGVEQNSDALVLEPDRELPRVALRPAPWQLGGSGYLLIVRMAEAELDRGSFVPPSLSGLRRGRVAYLIFVDYEQTACGPYRELLMVPGVFASATGKHASITRIYVSTYDSVVNGRKNWGIPKDRADFELQRDGEHVDHVRVRRNEKVFAELALRSRGPSLPVRSWLFPPSYRSWVQHWQGQSYRFSLSARGSMRLAKLLHWRFDPAYFPDLAQGRVLLAAQVPRFTCEFSAAEVGPITR